MELNKLLFEIIPLIIELLAYLILLAMLVNVFVLTEKNIINCRDTRHASTQHDGSSDVLSTSPTLLIQTPQYIFSHIALSFLEGT